MKRIIIILCIFLSATISRAQQAKFGIRAGVSFSNWNANTSEEDFKNRPGFDGSLLSEFFLSEKFSIQPEVGFSMYGIRFSTEVATGSYSLNYLTIPVLAKFTTTARITLYAGPQAAILLSGKVKDNASGKIDIKESFSAHDFFAVMGIGYELPAGFSAGFRYSVGLTDIYKEDEVSVKNKAISISVSYKRPFKQKK